MRSLLTTITALTFLVACGDKEEQDTAAEVAVDEETEETGSEETEETGSEEAGDTGSEETEETEGAE